jgi:hypothetical protein
MLGAILGGLSIATGLFGAHKQASAAEDQASDQAAETRRVAEFNRELSYYDAEVAKEEGQRIFERTAGQLYNTRYALESLLGTQMTRYAKSGVAVGTGSPLDVAAETGKIIARDVEMIKNEGRTGMQRAASLAERYKMLGDEGFRDAFVTAAMIESAGSDRALAYRISGVSQAAAGFFKLGESYGLYK